MLIAGLVALTLLEARAADSYSVADAQSQAVTILQELIQIDTSNGNETKAAEHLKKYFDAAGIDSKIYESAPGRGNIVARLKGDGSKKPILLVSHLDVVGVEREHWTLDPFKGEIKNGRIYGRGSSDIKDLAALELVTMIWLKKSGIPLHRDIIYVSVADEENHSAYGMDYMVKNHWPELNAEFAFNEGSRGKPYLKNGKVHWVSLQISERRSVHLRVVAHGTSAHSMLQMPDNALYTLGRALERISKYKPAMKLNAAIEQYIDGIARLEHRPKDWYKKEQTGDSEDSRGLYSMLHTTINPTMIKGGIRPNVIPAEAEVNLNVRLLPNVDINDIVRDLNKIISDPKVSIEIVGGAADPTVPISSSSSAAFKAYERVVKKTFGSAVPVIPTVGAGATDSRYLRGKGVDAYALEPFIDAQAQNAHGNDESLSLDGFKGGISVYIDLMKELENN